MFGLAREAACWVAKEHGFDAIPEDVRTCATSLFIQAVREGVDKGLPSKPISEKPESKPTSSNGSAKPPEVDKVARINKAIETMGLPMDDVWLYFSQELKCAQHKNLPESEIAAMENDPKAYAEKIAVALDIPF